MSDLTSCSHVFELVYISYLWRCIRCGHGVTGEGMPCDIEKGGAS